MSATVIGVFLPKDHRCTLECPSHCCFCGAFLGPIDVVGETWQGEACQSCVEAHALMTAMLP